MTVAVALLLPGFGSPVTALTDAGSPITVPDGVLAFTGGPTPLLRVVLVVSVRGVSEVIMDGVMTQHQITPGSGGQPATLTISGCDLTALMNLISFDGFPYPAMPVEARVLPRATSRGLRDAAHGDGAGMLRGAAIMAGLGVAVAGFAAGGVSAIRARMTSSWTAPSRTATEVSG